MRYYLWEIRIPPTWLPWVERDIRSTGWLLREVARFLVTFVVVTALFGRWNFTLLTFASLALGVGGIVALKEYLRKIAIAYQRYGSDWGEARALGIGSYVRMGMAILFAVVFVLVTR